jgi:uncharacterized membrane protein YraQ (UPF0718 family)
MNGACAVKVSNANWSRELKILGGFTAVFVFLFFLPVGVPRFDNALKEGLELTEWYAQEHVMLCLIPALFIAGGISAFVSQAAVMRYLGPKANKAVAYGVASVSGTILAVCSCTVLPLFGGIWMRGAGLGPATAFLYSGPAINVLAIVMTARILGMELGAARTIGAVGFSVVVGLAMHWVFRREEQPKAEAAAEMSEVEVKRPLWQNVLFFAAFADGQFRFLGGRGVHVFRHADGSAHLAGPHQQRHGERPRASAAAGRPRAFAAQHVGAPQYHGHEENGGLCVAGRCDGDDHRGHLWSVVRMKRDGCNLNLEQ